MKHAAHPDSILIIDFGTQVTQLIARRIREAGVYCEIHPFQNAAEAFARLQPKGVIFSGGPASVTTKAARARRRRCSSPACRSSASATASRRWRPARRHGRGRPRGEFGRADVEIKEASPLFDGVWEVGQRYPVWMSHGDRVTELPEGFKVIATSENAPFAIAVDEGRRYYRPCSTPRWCTRPTARSCSPTSSTTSSG